MIKIVKIILTKNKQFILYCFIGVTGVTLDFIAFYILHEIFNVYYLWANVISVSLGITNNFLLNAFLNFKITDKILNRFGKFYSIGLLGLIISSVLLYLLVEWLTLTPILSKVLTIFVVTIIQYTLNKKISFKES